MPQVLRNAHELEDFAKKLAEEFGKDEGRLRRMFSALATCTTPEEARAVIAFHYSRTDGKKRSLKDFFDYLEGMDEKDYRASVVPKLCTLFNLTMYYLTLSRVSVRTGQR
jgi:FPC/CPF motif-containing protein YcgG